MGPDILFCLELQIVAEIGHCELVVFFSRKKLQRGAGMTQLLLPEGKGLLPEGKGLKKLCEPSSIGGGTPGSLDCQLQHTRVVARRITLRNRTALARGLCVPRGLESTPTGIAVPPGMRGHWPHCARKLSLRRGKASASARPWHASRGQSPIPRHAPQSTIARGVHCAPLGTFPGAVD